MTTRSCGAVSGLVRIFGAKAINIPTLGTIHMYDPNDYVSGFHHAFLYRFV